MAQGLDSAIGTVDDLARRIDHTFLKPYGTPADIERLCAEARRYCFAMVAIHPAEIVRCARLLAGSGVRVGAAIGFPLGQSTPEIKAFETRDAIDRGAGEIDMVLNLRALRAGDLALVRREMRELAASTRSAGVISKVILEICYLSEAEKITACRTAREERIDFVKTSTGMASGGATVEDVCLMRRIVGPQMGVKAAGGIRTLAQAEAMLSAGANRLGTSNGVAIIEELRARLASS